LIDLTARPRKMMSLPDWERAPLTRARSEGLEPPTF